MKLNSPFIISSRLLPAIQLGKATIQLERAGQLTNGKKIYRWTIDLDGEEYSRTDLYCFGNLQEGFENFIAFLYSEASLFNYEKQSKRIVSFKNKLFPEEITRWAAAHEDELAMLEDELKNPNLIEE